MYIILLYFTPYPLSFVALLFPPFSFSVSWPGSASPSIFVHRDFSRERVRLTYELLQSCFLGKVTRLVRFPHNMSPIVNSPCHLKQVNLYETLSSALNISEEGLR